ncbi:MAG TPA: RNA-binding protein, partial [Planctomycetota bacterium]|nr:RNA-binding protein [Planctomycetota bacterium]
MTRLYVGNLSWNTTQESLRAAFEADGRSVKDVLIMSDRETGRSRGFAFVEMNSKEDAENAIRALDGADV